MQRPQTTDFGLNPFDPAFNADPFPLYRWLREHEPVHRSPLGFWALSRYEDVNRAFNDLRLSSVPSRYSSHNWQQQRQSPTARLAQHSLTFMDPPEHTRLRRLVGKVLTEQIARERQALIGRAVEDLISPCLQAGEIDVVADLAVPLPTRVIADFLAIPEADRSWLRDQASLFFPIFSPLPSNDVLDGVNGSILEFETYLQELIRQRRRQPGTDLLSEIIASQEGDDRLSDEELVASCILLFSNGVEALTHLIGNAVHALLRHPQQLALLQENPALMGSAVDEFMRYDSPSQGVGRITREPVTLHGIEIPAEAPVYLLIGSANRDGERFEHPDRLDITRTNNRHLSFGSGIHACLGAKLARAEAQAVFTQLLGQVRNINPLTRELQWKPRVFHRGLETLRISFDLA